jgi:hypothetical protein
LIEAVFCALGVATVAFGVPLTAECAEPLMSCSGCAVCNCLPFCDDFAFFPMQTGSWAATAATVECFFMDLVGVVATADAVECFLVDLVGVIVWLFFLESNQI